MKTITLSILLFVLLNSGFAQPIPTDSMYLSQSPPEFIAKPFIIPFSGGVRPVERITITSDGKEIYYCEIDTYPANLQRIKCYKYLNDKWQGPFVVFEGFMDPALSMNDSIMYMETNVSAFATAYYSVRNSTGWSTPVRCLSTNQWTHYYQETNPKNYYMSATFPGIASKDLGCRQINGTDTTIKNLGRPINTNMDENDFFIARDESYIIHARSSSSTPGDLFISYKKTNGGWTNSKTLGPQVNLPSPTWEFGCYVTKDNKYLFFTRGASSMSTYYIYWVRVDNLIDSLKHTNFVPYLKNQIPNQSDTVGRPYSFTFPDSTFIDDDGNNTLTYNATLADNSPLPAWLTFNSGTRTFTGTPASIGTLSIKINAIDTAGTYANCIFPLEILQNTAVNPENEKLEGYKLFQNFPNPFNPGTVISYSLLNNGHAVIKLYDIRGKEVATLINENQKRGQYSINVNMNNLHLSSGVYFYTLLVTEQNSNKVFRESKIMNYIK